jgi:hypothetical protein
MTNEIQRLKNRVLTLHQRKTELESEWRTAREIADGQEKQLALAVQRSRELEDELQRRPTTEAVAQLEARVATLTAALEAEQQATRRQAEALAAAHGELAALQQQVAALQQQRTATPPAVPVQTGNVI